MNRIESAFAGVIGLPCWGVQNVGLGSFLVLEFGRPSLHISEPKVAEPGTSFRVRRLLARRRVFVQGRWHLRIDSCEWSFRLHGRTVGDWTTKRRIENAARAL